MTPITKDALMDRGFDYHPNSSRWFILANNSHTIWVSVDDNTIRVDQQGRGDGPDSADVPNCTSIEQIDQLILLFLK